MKKSLTAILSLAVLFACNPAEKNNEVLELVSAETITVSAAGGDQTIEVNSDSPLTASSSEDWVSVTVQDKSHVIASVAPYSGDATRSATVTISNDSNLTPLQVRINQAAVVYDFKPTDYEFEAEGGQYSFPYTAEAALVATPDEYAEGWLTVEVTETEVVLKAEANTVVKTRSSIVEWTIGSAKGEFEVSQKGAPATFEGEFAAVNAPVGGTTVVYEYTTNSELVVNSDDAWIETYAEDGKLYIKVAANSGKVREGSVSWSVRNSDKSGDIAVTQKGSILTVNAHPMNYNSTLTSASVCVVYIHTETLAETIYIDYYSTTADIESLTQEELIKIIKNSSNKKDFSENATNCYTGTYGSLSNFGSNVPNDKIVIAAVYVNDGENEEVKLGYIHFTNGDQDAEWTLGQLNPVSNKSDYYGEYHLILSETDKGIDDFMDPDVIGNIYITDGESAVLDNGQTVEQLKISGLLNQLYFQRYIFSGRLVPDFDDTMYFYYVNGYINSVDDEYGPSYYDDGSEQYHNVMTLSEFSDDDGLYSAVGSTIGGIINDEGYIAFVGNRFDEVGDYVATWLFVETASGQQGYLTVYRDVILVPTGKPADQITVAAAQKKLAKIRTAMSPSKGNGSYVQRVDNMAFTRALGKVNAEEKNFVFSESIATCNAM